MVAGASVCAAIVQRRLRKAPTYKAERFQDAEPQVLPYFTKGISQLTSLATYTDILYP